MNSLKVNPFRPNSPVNPGMFIGRLQEIEKMESTLIQTGAGQSVNFMLTGERGIGKTSFLNYIKWLADGSITLKGYKFNFLVIETDIDQSTTQYGLIKKIEMGLRKQLAKTEKSRHVLSEMWEFLKRIESSGFSLKTKEPTDETISEEFAYSLSDTINRITDSTLKDDSFSAKYQGCILLLDEADKASKDLQLGSFLKLLLERLQRNKCYKFMVGLSGLPELRSSLYESHPSSLRLFDDISLGRLTDSEVSSVIDVCIDKAKESNSGDIAIDPDARQTLISLSEGYPHFIQQFGYSAFERDTDNIIDESDVKSSAFGPRCALDIIGDRYYRNDFYNRIQKENYRQVLRIMADNLDGWVTKKQIREKFKGSSGTLDNAINALRTRHIILTDETEKGKYRLQHKGFALWIKLYTQTTGSAKLPVFN